MLIKRPECQREVSDTAQSCPGYGYSLKPAPASASIESRILVEQRVANDGPNMVVAYILWFLLGLFGAIGSIWAAPAPGS